MIRTMLFEVTMKDMNNGYWIHNAINDWLEKYPYVELLNVSLSSIADQSGYLRKEHALITYRVKEEQ